MDENENHRSSCIDIYIYIRIVGEGREGRGRETRQCIFYENGVSRNLPFYCL